ncbi:hypothetical protein EEL52_13490 [Muribaculaceae bacterium Isolate-113 (HZI)]|nr:hypothetical protein [Muribaculaceae bacterium]ROS80775.1 hypothetical protein EEK90_14320 [Muribaculaceae bacterium Isolate-036 (Harlan)]ROT17541.1 hypothetical protein EEL53_14075 [Muribaculaceae bacterium Isolate-114 (HZI)]ROT18367.1 hypothetical protein EEL52_13490 [Muribaculaceae bacterium Isolate-113 (HZI)]
MAQTTVTRFCSKRCAEHSYKERMRQKKMALSNQETSQCNPDRKSRDKDQKKCDAANSITLK